MKLTMLPAGEGDALWLRWGPAEDRRQLLVDLGVRATGKAFRKRIQDLPPHERRFELLVVTHVDTDHIFGVLSGLAEEEPLEGLAFGEVWFNGWKHLAPSVQPPRSTAGSAGDVSSKELEAFGGVQGELLSHWLRRQNWNGSFDGGPVQRSPRVHELAHGLRVTVLGPTPQRLANLAPKWRLEVERALEKGALDEAMVDPALATGDLEPMGRAQERPELASPDDLKDLADEQTTSDRALPNGSSICLLIEHEGKRLLLAGDAFPEDVVEALAVQHGPEPVSIDAFKLPHHGSMHNVSVELVQAVQCRHWLVSTNGVKHQHPDPIAVARVLAYAKPRSPVLWFNEPSEFNGWWDNDAWRHSFGYDTRFGTATDGLEIEL